LPVWCGLSEEAGVNPQIRTVDSAADYARDLVDDLRPGSVVALDESAESLVLAQAIGPVRRLTVVTTGFDAATVLRHRADIEVILVSGTVDRSTRSIVAAGPDSFALGRQISRGYFGGSSFSPGTGLLEQFPGLARTKSLLAAQCGTCHAHIFADKVDHFALYPSVTIEQLLDVHLINAPGVPARPDARAPQTVQVAEDVEVLGRIPQQASRTPAGKLLLQG